MDIEAIKREMERLLAEDFPADTAAAVSGGNQDVAALPHYGRIQGADVISHLEHSLLNPDTTVETIMRECALARRLSVAAVCVAPYYVPGGKDRAVRFDRCLGDGCRLPARLHVRCRENG